MVSKTILVFMILASLFHQANAQDLNANPAAGNYGKPVVGKPLPDFTLDDITHYKKRTASTGDFKGKWLFMDFWFTGCAACIKSFPKVNEFQKEFKGDAVFLMVGENDKQYNNGIDKLYERLREKQGLTMPSAYDSIIVKRWEITAMPYILIVDPEGIIRYITDGRDMTREKVRDLIDGKEVSFVVHQHARPERPQFDPNNSGTDSSALIYQSILSKWGGEDQRTPQKISYWMRYIKKDGLKISMAPLEWIYNYAFTGVCMWDLPNDSLYGKVYPYPVIEVTDKRPFEFDYNHDVGKGTYNYGLKIPSSKATAEYVMTRMQQDLETAFGFKASLETREVPVWNLVVADSRIVQKLKTKGVEFWDSTDSSGGAAGFSGGNCTVDQFLEQVMNYIGTGQPPYFNETGIPYNIDLKMDCDMTNREAVRKELQRNGLDLVKGTRKMQVVVIRDPQPGDGHTAAQ